MSPYVLNENMAPCDVGFPVCGLLTIGNIVIALVACVTFVFLNVSVVYENLCVCLS